MITALVKLAINGINGNEHFLYKKTNCRVVTFRRTAYANEVDGVMRCASSFCWLTRSLPQRSSQAFLYWLFSVTSAEKKQLGFSCTVRRFNFHNPRRISCFIPSAKVCSEINVLQFFKEKAFIKENI